MASKLLTVKETASQLGLAPGTVWSWIYQRRLEIVRLGRSVRIPQRAIDDLIEAGTLPAKQLWSVKR